MRDCRACSRSRCMQMQAGSAAGCRRSAGRVQLRMLTSRLRTHSSRSLASKASVVLHTSFIEIAARLRSDALMSLLSFSALVICLKLVVIVTIAPSVHCDWLARIGLMCSRCCQLYVAHWPVSIIIIRWVSWVVLDYCAEHAGVFSKRAGIMCLACCVEALIDPRCASYDDWLMTLNHSIPPAVLASRSVICVCWRWQAGQRINNSSSEGSALPNLQVAH